MSRRGRKPAAQRRVSLRGLRAIARFEGFRAQAYKPVAAEPYWTIGYGHYGPSVYPGQRISRALALVLLRRDARAAEDEIRRLVYVPLTQGEYDALVSLAYNIGAGQFATSTVLRELNRGHRHRAADAFLLWDRGASGVLSGLRVRRHAERRRFLR